MNSLPLPTKKLFLIAVPLIALFAIIIAVKEPFNNDGGTEQVSVVENKNLLPLLNEVDTDKDGLKDWEESLWKTNPNSVYSDGRTESDYEYVQNIIKNSSKETAFSNIASSTTLTEAFSIEFFNEYWNLKQSGKITNQTIATLTNRLAENVLSSQIKANYSIPSNKILANATNDQLYAYGNRVAEIRGKYQYLYSQNAVNSSDFNATSESQIASLAASAKLYDEIAIELQALQVPALVVTAHEALINSYLQSSAGLEALSFFNKDSVKAIAGIQTHTNAQIIENSAIEQLRRFFIQSGIIFSTNEPGSFWN